MTKQLTTETFAQEIQAGVTLVDFGATWCPPCKMIEPVVEELAQEFDGKASVTKVDVDQSPELAQLFNVRSIPTLIFFKDGKPVDATIGVQSKKVLADKLANQL